MIDYPVKQKMLDLNLLLERKGGRVERMGEGGLHGVIDLLGVADDLYRTTRVLRIFTMERRLIDFDEVLATLSSGT
jgi:hypothetical protein